MLSDSVSVKSSSTDFQFLEAPLQNSMDWADLGSLSFDVWESFRTNGDHLKNRALEKNDYLNATASVYINFARSLELIASSKTRESSKYQRTLQLLAVWEKDKSGYDEKIWPRVKKTIEENRLSDRKTFRD